jgi:hypothetical protein
MEKNRGPLGETVKGMNAAANTRECFSVCVGRQVVGVLFNACPPSRPDLAVGTKTLVFDNGCGLTVAENGTFWIESVETINLAVDQRKAYLKTATAELEGVLALAGRPVDENR